MANGKLGIADLVATTNTDVYSVPTGKTATVNISVSNRASTSVAVRVAIAATVSPTASEYIEHDVTIPPYGVLERTGVVMTALEKVVCYASASGISVRIHGFEEIL